MAPARILEFLKTDQIMKEDICNSYIFELRTKDLTEERSYRSYILFVFIYYVLCIICYILYIIYHLENSPKKIRALIG